jgi:hypothetical protein
MQGGFDVRLRRSGRTIPIPEGKTILRTLLDAGVDAHFSCAMGMRRLRNQDCGRTPGSSRQLSHRQGKGDEQGYYDLLFRIEISGFGS